MDGLPPFTFHLMQLFQPRCGDGSHAALQIHAPCWCQEGQAEDVIHPSGGYNMLQLIIWAINWYVCLRVQKTRIQSYTYIVHCIQHCGLIMIIIRANPSVCPRRRRRHVRTSKNTVFCGTKCTCPWSWLSSCNAQLRQLFVECYNNNIIINIINIISIITIIIIIIIIFIFTFIMIFLIPLLIFPIECKV